MPTKPAVRGRTDQVRFFCNAREPAYTSEEGRKNRRKPIHYREPRSPSLNFQSHRLRLVYCVTSRAALDLALTLAPPQQSLCTQRTVGFKLAQKESNVHIPERERIYGLGWDYTRSIWTQPVEQASKQSYSMDSAV